MSEDSHFKQAHAWRSKFRSRQHDQAHEDAAPEQQHDHSHDDVFRGKASMVESQQDLAALVDRLRAAGSFAFDSEFIGEMSYTPKLCLIQIATTSEVALVDPLAPIDLREFWELLVDPSVQKIVHAGGQDMEPALRIIGKPATNVVDTQIAAAFARLPYPLSLQRLVLQLLDIRIGKGLTFTHWDQRPLSAQQIRYAADDVRYLPAAWQRLHAAIESAGNMASVREECDLMCAASPYRFDPDTSYLKVRGSGTLDARQLGIMRALSIWRDGAARDADLPPRSFLKDEIMVDLTRRAPTTEERLMNIQGLPRPIRMTHGQAILDAIRQGAAKPIHSTGAYRKNEELPRQQFQTDAVHALMQTLCLSRGVDPAMAFTRADAGELIAGIREGRPLEAIRLMQGWRRELIGEPVAQLIRSGQAAHFRVADGELTAGDAGVV